jgi:PAS domain S-box-containing protein
LRSDESRIIDRSFPKDIQLIHAFKFLFEKANDAFFLLDRNGKVLTANPILVRMLGYNSLDELLDVNIGRDLYFRKEDRDDWQRKLEQEDEIRNAERVLKRKDGRKLIVLENVHVVRDKKGAILYYEGTITDITERKMLDERLSALNLCASKMNTAQDFDQVYELTLDAIERALGFENAAFMVAEKTKLRCVSQRGKLEPWLDLPLDGSRKGITVKAATTLKPVLVHDVRKDKDYFEAAPGIRSEIAIPIEIEGKIYGVIDIESKKLEAFNKKDVELLQILASHAATAIGNLEKRAEIEKRSSQLASMMKSSADVMHSTDLRQRLQKTAEAIREFGWRRVVIRAVNENMETADLQDLVTAGLTDEETEFLWSNRVPGQVWRERFGPEFERFEIGEFYHLPWSDPWVRKRFSEGTVSSRLTQEEMVDWDPQDLLYAPLCLTDDSIVGILSIDDPIDGKRPTKESLAPLELFIHQAAVAIENAQLIKQLNNARNQIEEYADQLELKVKQRTQELVEAQNKLLKSERLAAIGEIAGMVGHDLRNPLTSIAGATYYLRTKLHPRADKKTEEMLKIIEKDIEYSNKIVNDLLDYSREIHLELNETTPKAIVDEALLRVKIPKKIQLVNSVSSTSIIRVDSEKMKRVFLNIIKNAVDAMPKGGKLTIKGKEKSDEFEVCFADTGVGISEEVVDKLWSPLFTTKAKGMGFGLPICKRIVEAHGGIITVESVAGKGTTFAISVPIEPKIEGGGVVWVNVPESLLSMMMKA